MIIIVPTGKKNSHKSSNTIPNNSKRTTIIKQQNKTKNKDNFIIIVNIQIKYSSSTNPTHNPDHLDTTNTTYINTTVSTV